MARASFPAYHARAGSSHSEQTMQRSDFLTVHARDYGAYRDDSNDTRIARVLGSWLVLSCLALGCGSDSNHSEPDSSQSPRDAEADAGAGAGARKSDAASPSTQPADASVATDERKPDAGPMAGSGGDKTEPKANAGAGGTAPAKPMLKDAAVVPWGVAPSASSSRAIGSWAATVATAGVRWVRGFDGSQLDTVFSATEASNLALSGILMYSPPGTDLSFPVGDLPGWDKYVADTVSTAKRVRHWEVWNEPPNFSTNPSPADYATIVAHAYDAAKSANQSALVGLAAQSVNLNFLAQALDAGASGHFDYVTLHPYETLDLLRYGWEPQFLSIVPTVRKLLADKSPAQKDVPVLFTELGAPVGETYSQEAQADLLVKAYVLSLAQGVARIHWFEPLDGDSGPFGLVDKFGAKRPSFAALHSLVSYLGEEPRFLGWTTFAEKAYGFVFQGSKEPIMVAWTPPMTRHDLDLGQKLKVARPGYADEMELTGYTLRESPVIIAGLPTSVVDEAKANVGKAFPWGGDFSAAESVSYAAPDAVSGLHPAGTLEIVTVDGQPALDVTNTGGGMRFAVDPNFNSYTPTRLQVEAEVRGLKNGAWFMLKYESVTGYKASGDAYHFPDNDAEWHTLSWTLEDPQFVGKWGYQLGFGANLPAETGFCIRRVTVSKLN